MRRVIARWLGTMVLLGLGPKVGIAQDYFVPLGVSPTPIFAEDFEGTGLDGQVWSWFAQPAQAACENSAAAVSVDSGYLTLRSFSTPDAGARVRRYCAMISSRNAFTGRYGYWEAAVRIKRSSAGVQAMFGLHPAPEPAAPDAALSATANLQVYGHAADAASIGYRHAVSPAGAEQGGLSWVYQSTREDLADGEFHTFGVLWTPERYAFFIDGVQSGQVPDSVPVASASHAVVLSVAVGAQDDAGLDPNHPPGAQTTFDVDYVRVYPLLQ